MGSDGQRDLMGGVASPPKKKTRELPNVAISGERFGVTFGVNYTAYFFFLIEVTVEVKLRSSAKYYVFL